MDNWTLDGKSILVTGGTGSFGREFIKTVLRDYQPRRLVVFSRDELKQSECQKAWPDDGGPMRYFIGDVRDRDRLMMALRGIDVVVHAAAMKQVPASAYNPEEAKKTNIDGAVNVIRAALDCGVERVIALSSDKACAPCTLYGATKLTAEHLFVQANSYRGTSGTRFACVRYGNVVGSRGSIVPLFREQRASGGLTITDERMTRFLITLQQGVAFVLSSLALMRGGEVFIPKLPSVRVVDIARAIAPECQLVYVGIRPTEKLHEAMIAPDEARQAVDLGDRYAILPAHPWWQQENYCGRHLPEGFSYTSDNNDRWLTKEELEAMIEC